MCFVVLLFVVFCICFSGLSDTSGECEGGVHARSGAYRSQVLERCGCCWYGAGAAAVIGGGGGVGLSDSVDDVGVGVGIPFCCYCWWW